MQWFGYEKPHSKYVIRFSADDSFISCEKGTRLLYGKGFVLVFRIKMMNLTHQFLHSQNDEFIDLNSKEIAHYTQRAQCINLQ